jgi:hypothetical protein
MKTKELKQLHLRTTGGMGITLEGSMDIESLPDELARQVATELTPRKLSRVARRKAVSFAPGQQEYEITLVTAAKGEPKRYAFTDQQADPELLDLLDELTAAMIREKMRARRTRQQQKRQQGEKEIRQETPTTISPEEGISNPAATFIDIAESGLEENEENDALASASLG